jgi:hypothetical protein
MSRALFRTFAEFILPPVYLEYRLADSELIRL